MKYKTFRMTFKTAVTLVVIGLAVLAYRRFSSGGSSTTADAPAPAQTDTTTAGNAEPAPQPQAAADQEPTRPAGARQPEAADPTSTSPLREMDQRILARVAQGMSGDKVKDAFSSAAYKVNLYRDSGYEKANRLKVDLNRNEKWDEKWTLDTSGSSVEVKRQVAPADDEHYTVEYRLVEGQWVKK